MIQKFQNLIVSLKPISSEILTLSSVYLTLGIVLQYLILAENDFTAVIG